jgi:hypothetical protein
MESRIREVYSPVRPDILNYLLWSGGSKFLTGIFEKRREKDKLNAQEFEKLLENEKDPKVKKDLQRVQEELKKIPYLASVTEMYRECVIKDKEEFKRFFLEYLSIRYETEFKRDFHNRKESTSGKASLVHLGDLIGNCGEYKYNVLYKVDKINLTNFGCTSEDLNHVFNIIQINDSNEKPRYFLVDKWYNSPITEIKKDKFVGLFELFDTKLIFESRNANEKDTENLKIFLNDCREYEKSNGYKNLIKFFDDFYKTLDFKDLLLFKKIENVVLCVKTLYQTYPDFQEIGNFEQISEFYNKEVRAVNNFILNKFDKNACIKKYINKDGSINISKFIEDSAEEICKGQSSFYIFLKKLHAIFPEKKASLESFKLEDLQSPNTTSFENQGTGLASQGQQK